jgi:hypothetical protein
MKFYLVEYYFHELYGLFFLLVKSTELHQINPCIIYYFSPRKKH